MHFSDYGMTMDELRQEEGPGKRKEHRVMVSQSLGLNQDISSKVKDSRIQTYDFHTTRFYYITNIMPLSHIIITKLLMS